MADEQPTYCVYCPRCGTQMIENGKSYLEGTLAESTDECTHCGFLREYAYGHWQEHAPEPEDAEDAKLIGMYDHLNKDSHLTVSLSMVQLVEMVRGMNYGVHRFLSELVRQRRALQEHGGDRMHKADPDFKRFTDDLEALLNEGFY